ncbi:pyridoxamine 5'-phosphate oxidase family protein [Candidatus Stoquefichus massiliensis]|uniref:pyridoxamine 5'-phosphate oxidase family protein n=1 Tax=Candidatus Stoquefichus massiliensis TaxID=1470350 RepID=UPI0004B72F48|nr:pyridoxamine 5'-phosphate oxidase family protein [Candidatus Stoquefichus massiliensis]
MIRDVEKTIGNLIDKATLTVISSLDENCFPISKAMLSPRKREGIQVFYLTTNTSSLKVQNFKRDSRATLYFVDKRFYRGVSLLGHVEILEDHASKEMIWLDGDTMYYPLGVDDPDYCVIKFTAFKGRYYRQFQSIDFDVPCQESSY